MLDNICFKCKGLEEYKKCKKIKKIKIKHLKKEINSIDIYTSNIGTEKIKGRIEDVLYWYIRKATFYKKLFYGLSITLIIINASIPFINQLNVEGSSIIVTFISSAATIITSILTLFTMKDSWFRYRNHAELIKKECSLFNGDAGIYSKDDKEKLLIIKIEEIIGQEVVLWESNKRESINNQIIGGENV